MPVDYSVVPNVLPFPLVDSVSAASSTVSVSAYDFPLPKPDRSPKEPVKEAPFENLYEIMPVLPFKNSPSRLAQVRQILSAWMSTTTDMPTLIVDHPMDVLPVLTALHQVKSSSKQKMRMACVTPNHFDIEDILLDSSPDAYDKQNEAFSRMETIAQAADEEDTTLILSGLAQYDHAEMEYDFLRIFQDREGTNILVVTRAEKALLDELVQCDAVMNASLDDVKEPYTKHIYSRCRPIEISSMTADEKAVFLKYHGSKMLAANGFSLRPDAMQEWISESIRLFEGDAFFMRSFEILDKVQGCLLLEGKGDRLTVAHIQDAFHELAPQHDRGRALLDLDERLEKKIFGQSEAIQETYELIISVCDDETRTKPLVLGFFGPSGVGKTALAEELSLALNGQPVACINMSEYADDIKSTQLTGSSTGYVGSEDEGRLAQIIHANPHTVLLLDEFEKASPKIRQLFLNLFDKGKIQDNSSGELDFSKATIILTSNAGVEADKSMGFGSENTLYRVSQRKIEQTFAPELLGRLDARILFNPLSDEALNQVVDKFMHSFEPRFQKLGVTVCLSDTARRELIDMGKNPQTGARPLMNVMRRRIKAPIELAAIKGYLPQNRQVIVMSVREEAPLFPPTVRSHKNPANAPDSGHVKA